MAGRTSSNGGGRGRGGSPSQGRPQSRGKAQAGRGAKGYRSDRRSDNPRGRQDRGPQRGSRPSSAPRGLAKTGMIEGRRAVFEALETGLPLKSALVERGQGNQDPKLDELVERLTAADVEVTRVPRSTLDEMSSHGAHQGIMVETEPFSYCELSDVIARAGTGDALVILLDHVTDEGNFGAIVRSAEVVGAAGVVIPKVRSAGVGTAAYKTSAGAVLHLPIAQVPNLATAVEDLKAAGFWVGAATEHAEECVWEAPIGGRVAIVMGSEGDGVSRLVLDRCDFGCRLPQRGRVESLNVAQAATVLAYEWLRRTFDGSEERLLAESGSQEA